MRYVALWSGEYSTGPVTGQISFDSLNSSSEDTHGAIVSVKISGLERFRPHAIHIHENRYNSAAEMAKGPSVLGGHFNPHDTNHGSIFTEDRHAGDLINNFVTDTEGTITFHYVDEGISVYEEDETFIGNRSVVVHAGVDDLGLMGRVGVPYSKMNRSQLMLYGLERSSTKELIEGSRKHGNAGKRIATCNIDKE